MMVQVYVNGMYAFVLYDSAQDLYMAARDPVGQIFFEFFFMALMAY
jgi:asparagine synthetase B (glutamine-hydrolysing)